MVETRAADGATLAAQIRAIESTLAGMPTFGPVRFTADLAPGTRILHLLGTAICWLVAAFIWMVKVIPQVATDPEE